MHRDKRINKLTSIPEKNENEDEDKRNDQWVPKKKHDVLKAKYKCLKKLFQIYDANVIGMLPQVTPEDDNCEPDETPRRRKKRSYHRRTDACTSVINASQVKQLKDSENNTDELTQSEKNLSPRSDTSIQVENIAKSLLKIPSIIKKDDKSVQGSTENIPKANAASITEQKPAPSNQNIGRKSRFQSYIQRLFGIKSESRQSPSSRLCHGCTKSDNNLCTCNKKRKRRVLKVTSPRRCRHVTSEVNLRDTDILSYVQSVQRRCLMDTSPRQCPFPDCNCMTYGIINYNDHLNLCHFPQRKYICHYCHEGFELNKDKLIHENEHIGINKLSNNLTFDPYKDTIIKSDKKISVTQTDSNLSDEKLLKIMSLIEKYPDPEILMERVTKRDGFNAKRDKDETCNGSNSCGKKTLSWPNFSSARGTRGLSKSASESPRTTTNSSFSCKMCGDAFANQRYLQFHVDVDHRDIDPTPRDHHLNPSPRNHHSVHQFPRHHHKMKASSRHPPQFLTKDGTSTSGLSRVPSTSTCHDFGRNQDIVSYEYDPSTNIIYYTSLESIDGKNSVEGMRVNSNCYKWESETKIIHV